MTRLISLMDHTPGQRQYPNLEEHKRRWKENLGLTDAEVEARYQDMRQNQAEHAPRNRSYAAAYARERNLPLASHDDGDIAHVDEALAHAAMICEFPTTLAAAKTAKDHGMTVVMGAPNLMRGGSYSGNVSAEEVAAEGLLDAFASDYVPRSMIEGAFALTRAPFNWDLPRAIATVTATPAECADLADRGRIENGKRADFLRVRLVDNRPKICGVWIAGERVG